MPDRLPSSLSEIAKYRLSAQRIAHSDFKTPADVVRWMGAMQAQDYAGSKWAIGVRLPDITERDVEQAVRDRQILRTWPQRGTIHFVVPEEVRWRLSLTAPRIVAAAKTIHRNAGLDEATFEKSREILTSALRGDKQLARPELMRVLQDNGVSTANQRGYHILWYLAQNGHLCFGPLDGKQVTFALLDEWVPKTDEIPREEALKRLVSGYFRSHGPATVQDLMWWSGMTANDIKTGLEMVKPLLISTDIEGKTYWLSRETPNVPADSLYLLPSFDEFLLGYKDRTATLDMEHMPKIVPGMNGTFAAIVVINGETVGIWRRTIKKDVVEIHLATFAPLTTHQRDQLDEIVQKYGMYLGLSVHITE